MEKNYTAVDPNALNSLSEPYKTIANLLFQLISVNDCLGYTQLTVSDAAPIKLGTTPRGVSFAYIEIEADSNSSSSERVVRFTEDGSNPTATRGMTLGDNGVYEVKGTFNLENFQIIGIDAGISHKINVQYF